MPAFVMVPGALHGAWAWERILPAPAEQGHNAFAPDLPGTGSTDSIPVGSATLAMWTDFLVNFIRDAGEPVVLVGHNRGGLVIGEAAERVPELVSGLIYATALVGPPGKITFGVMGPQTTSHGLAMSEDGGNFSASPELATSLFHNACTDEDAAWAAARLCPDPVAIMSTPAAVSCERWGSLPRASSNAPRIAR